MSTSTVFMSTGTVIMSTGHCIHVHWHCVFMTTGTVFMSTSTVFLEPMNIRTSRLFWRSVCQVSAGVILPGTWFLVSQAFTIIKKGSPVNFFAPLKAILIWNLKRTVSWEFPYPIFFSKQGSTETTIFTFVLSFKMMFNFKFFRWAEVFGLLIQTPLLNEGPSLHSLIKNTVV